MGAINRIDEGSVSGNRVGTAIIDSSAGMFLLVLITPFKARRPRTTLFSLSTGEKATAAETKKVKEDVETAVAMFKQ